MTANTIQIDPARPSRPRCRTDRRRERADLRAYAESRDAQARERLVVGYLPLANSVARQFAHRGPVPLDDLKQIAAVGVLKALDRYDPGRGVAFSSFAVPTIRGEILRYLRDHTWTVRPPRNLQELGLRVERERERLASQLGRNPTAAELANRVGCTIEEIIDASQAGRARTAKSLDGHIEAKDAEGDTLGDQLGTEDCELAAVETSAVLDRLVSTLDERDRRVLRLRFWEDLTQAEIGERIGCSQMHASRIIRDALAQLAETATAHARELLDPPPPRSALEAAARITSRR